MNSRSSSTERLSTIELAKGVADGSIDVAIIPQRRVRALCEYIAKHNPGWDNARRRLNSAETRASKVEELLRRNTQLATRNAELERVLQEHIHAAHQKHR